MANNNEIFNAVLSGISGGVQHRWLSNTSASSYNSLLTAINAIAVAVDAKIPADTIYGGDAKLMENIAHGVFSNRFPPLGSVLDVDVISDAIVNLNGGTNDINLAGTLLNWAGTPVFSTTNGASVLQNV